MDPLAEVAALLDGTYDKRGRVARGAHNGIPIAVHFALRGTGYERTSYERQWTEIDVGVPRGYGLSLYVRRHEWDDTRRIARKEMVDIALGDPVFDRQFLVEAAPAQIARAVLTAPIRNLLTSHDTALLTSERVGDRDVVRLAVRTWLPGGSILLATDLLAALSASLRDAYASVATAALHGAGAPYRPTLDEALAERQLATLADEVASVAGLRTKR